VNGDGAGQARGGDALERAESQASIGQKDVSFSKQCSENSLDQLTGTINVR
jgi:hypothetical protein